MAAVHYSTLAAEDLYENAEYISRDNPAAAYRWIDKIESTCEMLAENRETGQQRTTRHHGRCRSFVSGNYVIFFRGAADGIEVVRIVRAERDLDQF
jgi:toxin ParE1/3/4